MTKHIKTLLFSLAVSHACIAAEAELPATDKMVESPTEITSQLKRANSKYEGLLTYSPIDLIIPSKLGFTLGYIQNASSTWQLEVLRGSLSAPLFFTDIGKMTDLRISLLRRSYFKTNSFYLSYGFSYMNFSTKLGSEYISAATMSTKSLKHCHIFLASHL